MLLLGLVGYADSFPRFWILGWMSLVTIIEHLKDRIPKRGSEAGIGGLTKRVRGVELSDD